MTRALRILARPWVIIALTILANLAIPRPTEAYWENDICWDPDVGGVVACCTFCIFFCECDEELLLP
jgi:hypothetical protein